MKPGLIVVAGLAVIALAGLGWTVHSIRSDASKSMTVAEKAWIAKGGKIAGKRDVASAMLDYIKDGKHGIAERDRMIWAIQYTGDAETAGELKKLLTGKPCVHRKGKPHTELCQYELEKAIRNLERGVLPILRPDAPVAAATIVAAANESNK